MRNGVRHLPHAVHQPADAVQHVVDYLGELIELVAAAGNLDALREIARGNRGGRGGHVGDGTAEQAAHDDGARSGHCQHDRHRPDQRVGQQIAKLYPDLHVAAHEQMIAVRKFVTVY